MTYRILLNNKVEKDVLWEIKSQYSEDVEGISGLYDQLILHGACDSDIPSGIYYTAYTLALRDIEIVIVRLN